ncbi:ABC transporter permease subunit [bacterium]|nr:ABC transporter permease subunit [bacterium]
MTIRISFLLVLCLGLSVRAQESGGEALSKARATGVIRFGADMEGGAPYFIPNPKDPANPGGFEADFLKALGGKLGIKPELRQGQWDQLPRLMAKGDVDFICNGFELKPLYASRYRATRPYFRYRLALMVPGNSPATSWDDFLQRSSTGRKMSVGVLVNSAADTYATETGAGKIEIVRFDGATDAMMATRNGQIDATLQDEPAATYYAAQPGFTGRLKITPDRFGPGWYVIYVRKEDAALAEAIDQGIAALLADGTLQRIYENYGLWHEDQALLSDDQVWRADLAATTAATTARPPLRDYIPMLLKAAAMTVFLSVTSMPLAMAIGLSVAVGRLYGPKLLRPLLVVYVEFLRGTPLMLQLFFIFYIVPEILGFGLPAVVAAILGLAINYSAYEAEIYRAGLQAIPDGQMEAGLALGMTRRQTLRHIIIPQATRIVIPPVTNDFIALFKDTSVCSVITVVELTKQYSILANSTLRVIEFAIMASVLYLMMSWPLSKFAAWYERKLEAEEPR